MSLENQQLGADYDAVPYQSSAVSSSLPDNLYTLAAMAGFESAPPTNCRVLEIGCALGRNLLPMAVMLPESRFLGIDLSATQIEAGKEELKQAGVTNLELRCQDMLDFGAGEGIFDYIIAHGIYSWVPGNVRKKLLEICATNLSPRGLAYISYNTLPGYHLKNILRDMMLFHARSENDSARRIAMAREMLEFAATQTPGWATYIDVRTRESKVRSSMADWDLIHDEMESVNHPVYFRDFVRDAAGCGLSYLADAEVSSESFNFMTPDLQEKIRKYSSNAIDVTEYADFLTGRAFRSSVLCHSTAAPVAANPEAVVMRMHAASNAMREIVPGTGGQTGMRLKSMTSSMTMTLGDLRIAPVFDQMKKAWPHAVPFEELLDTVMATTTAEDRQQVAPVFAGILLTAYRSGVIELWSRPTVFLARRVDKPCVSKVARLQISRDQPIVNLRHQLIPVNPALRPILLMMDGTRTRDELMWQIERAIKRNEPIARLPGIAKIGKSDRKAILEAILADLAIASLLAPE